MTSAFALSPAVDTFSFNNTILKAEITSGGDYKGDVISVLSIARQKALRGDDTAIISTTSNNDDEDNNTLGSNGSGGSGRSPITALYYNGRKIANVEFSRKFDLFALQVYDLIPKFT